MAGIDTNSVYLPTPDQNKTTGAVAIAPAGTDMPEDAREVLTTPWESGGYVGEDGITLSTNKSVDPIKDWSQNVIRKTLTEFDGQMTVPFLQIDEWSAKRLIGSANVATKAASSTAGKTTIMKLGAQLPEIEAWCFSMKDEDRRVRIFCPRAQITEIDEVAFVPNTANNWPATLSCYADEDGYSIYVIYDDGTVLAA